MPRPAISLLCIRDGLVPVNIFSDFSKKMPKFRHRGKDILVIVRYY